VVGQERADIAGKIREMLPGKQKRRHELIAVALKTLSGEPDQDVVIVIQHQSILRAKKAQLVNRWTHLGREREIGRYALLLGYDDPKLVDDLCFAHAPEKRARKTVRDNTRSIGSEKLRDPRNAMTDDVLQQLPWKLADPVLAVTEQCARVARL